MKWPGVRSKENVALWGDQLEVRAAEMSRRLISREIRENIKLEHRGQKKMQHRNRSHETLGAHELLVYVQRQSRRQEV